MISPEEFAEAVEVSFAFLTRRGFQVTERYLHLPESYVVFSRAPVQITVAMEAGSPPWVVVTEPPGCLSLFRGSACNLETFAKKHGLVTPPGDESPSVAQDRPLEVELGRQAALLSRCLPYLGVPDEPGAA